MEIWTDIEFTMPTDVDYNIMELIAKNFFDDDDHWPVEEYNPEARSIKFESVLATQEEAIEFATDLLEQINERLSKKASESLRQTFENFTYTMQGHTDNGGYTESVYVIERQGDKLTMKESCFSHEDFDGDDEVYDSAFEAWSDNPEYGEEINLKGNRIKTGEVFSANEMIIEYLKANNLPHDEATIQKLSVDDVYAIMAGTYGKSE